MNHRGHRESKLWVSLCPLWFKILLFIDFPKRSSTESIQTHRLSSN
jgi:hypothetical protein